MLLSQGGEAHSVVLLRGIRCYGNWDSQAQTRLKTAKSALASSVWKLADRDAYAHCLGDGGCPSEGPGPRHAVSLRRTNKQND
jgi:hypothetical protein